MCQDPCQLINRLAYSVLFIFASSRTLDIWVEHPGYSYSKYTKSILRKPKIFLNAIISLYLCENWWQSVSSLKNEGISSATVGEPAGAWELAFQGECCLHGCCPPLPPSLSSSLFPLLLNNHILFITLAKRFQHSNSSGNSCMLAITVLSKNFNGPVCVCVYTLHYIKCLWYLGNCSNEEKESHQDNGSSWYQLSRGYRDINPLTGAMKVLRLRF